MIRHKSTEFMTFSMCLGNFVVALLWAIYGQLVQDNFILVSELSLLSTVLHHNSQGEKKKLTIVHSRQGTMQCSPSMVSSKEESSTYFGIGHTFDTPGC